MRNIAKPILGVVLVVCSSISWGADLDGVYYCIDDAAVGIYDGVGKTYKPNRFTMQIEGNRVVTIQEPSFSRNGQEIKPDPSRLLIQDSLYEMPNFIARAPGYTLVMYDNRYTLGMQIMTIGTLSSGTCNKF